MLDLSSVWVRTATTKWQCKNVCPCDAAVNAYLAGHTRKLGLSTLGNEIFASLKALYGKDRLFKKGSELGLGSDLDAKGDHGWLSLFFVLHTSPPKV